MTRNATEEALPRELAEARFSRLYVSGSTRPRGGCSPTTSAAAGDARAWSSACGRSCGASSPCSEMEKDGAYPDAVWELAADMRRGYWEWAGRRHPLLPRAEGLGCARLGIPVLPWKQKRQSEREGRGRG